MSRKQIAARVQGDDYQARFFWYQAAQLLFPDSPVEKVKLENDDAPHIDDVTVIYHSPGRRDGKRNCSVDFFQVKFHVDHNNAYSAEGLIDPSFIGSKSKSLLQRFFNTFVVLRDTHSWFTLGLVSNWTWRGDDNLAKSIRQSGALPDQFFTDGTKSDIGRIRETWRAHVQTDEATFQEFASRLRLKLNYFGYGDFNTTLNDRLYRAGLVPMEQNKDASIYDDLTRKFIVNGTTEFNATQLSAICEREGLLREITIQQSARRIGFRTFIPFAEVLETETSAFVCGADLFDGRHPRSIDTWTTLYKRISDFVDEQRLNLNNAHEVLLDCHTSAALAIGYLITSRAAAFPVGPRPGQKPQRPSENIKITDSNVWSYESQIYGPAKDIAIVVSITHGISDDVLRYLHNHDNQVGLIMNFTPNGGSGVQSIRDADHAIILIDALITQVRLVHGEGVLKHLFIAAPNFFTYFLGQRIRAIGDIIVYEYDFDGPEPREYHASFRFPPT